MNTVEYDVNRTCVLQPFSGDKVDWIRLQLCSLIAGSTWSDAIDRNVAIQSDPIEEKTILIPYKLITFSTFCKTLILKVPHRGFSSVNQKVNI